MTRTLTIAAALAGLSFGTAGGQEPERRELERQLAETQDQVRDLQRQLRELRRERGALIQPRVEVRGPREGRRVATLMSGRPRLGVVVRTQPRPSSDTVGAVLEAVSPGGPAAQAGLKAGDIVVSVNGERLASAVARNRDESPPGRRLIELARELDEGDSVKVEYRRDGTTRSAVIVAREVGPEGFGFGFSTDSGPFHLGRLAFDDRFDDLDFRIDLAGPGLDMELATLNPDLGEYFGTTEGLLVVRAPRGGELGLRSGDVILSIEGRTPSSASQAMRILRSYEAGDAVQFQVMRQKKRSTVSGKMPERDRAWFRDRRDEQ